MWIWLHGFGLSAGLIVAIGAQNAFVLRQAASRQHVFATALTAALCDVLLISIGVLGVGLLIINWPGVAPLLQYGGAAFLLWFGWNSARRALQPVGLQLQGLASVSLRRTLLASVAFSLLNPHAWLDAAIMIGSSAQQYLALERLLFAAGAMCASFCWFFCLAYGAKALGPWLTRPPVWRAIDAIVALMMLSLAGLLLLR